jgi:hypothetical protein
VTGALQPGNSGVVFAHCEAVGCESHSQLRVDFPADTVGMPPGIPAFLKGMEARHRIANTAILEASRGATLDIETVVNNSGRTIEALAGSTII